MGFKYRIETLFQSTYLYKVRLSRPNLTKTFTCFNPRTYIRYDMGLIFTLYAITSFNPRTYIRYDYDYEKKCKQTTVSIHVPI